MYHFAIITSVMMNRGDPSKTNRPYLRARCHSLQLKILMNYTSSGCIVDLQQLSGLRTTRLLLKLITTPSNC
jgi:hypothetical protein